MARVIDQKNFSTNEAAKRLGVSAMFLRDLRKRGGGPRYRKVSATLVLYPVAEMDAWCESHTLLRSTADEHAQRAKPQERKPGVKATLYHLFKSNPDASR